MSTSVDPMTFSPHQLSQWKEQGYFIVRRVVPTEAIDEIRTAILEFVTGKRELSAAPELVKELDAMPMDELRSQIRKLGGIGRQTECIWNHWYAAPSVLEIVRQFLKSSTIYLKYDSVFLKPARVGGATPWHQDIGLWRDTNSDAFNAWLAVDPATRENGCLQFVSGTHTWPITPHVKYPDMPHGEIPRKLVERTIAERGVEHIELQPGDAVFWQSHLWHYSPPNRSDLRRIGMGAVWISPDQVPRLRMTNYALAMQDGQPERFPPRPAKLEPGLHMAVNEHIDLRDIV